MELDQRKRLRNVCVTIPKGKYWRDLFSSHILIAIRKYFKALMATNLQIKQMFRNEAYNSN